MANVHYSKERLDRNFPNSNAHYLLRAGVKLFRKIVQIYAHLRRTDVTKKNHCSASILELLYLSRAGERYLEFSCILYSRDSEQVNEPVNKQLCKQGHWLDSCPQFLEFEIGKKSIS